MTAQDFHEVFRELRRLLEPLGPRLLVKKDAADVFYLDAPWSEKWKREVYFGSVEVKKNYVSFHLMPVYMFPDLLDGLSPDLKKRMQGKSCFNFKRVEPALVSELEELTERGFARYESEGLV
jgi:hypothetical protein